MDTKKPSQGLWTWDFTIITVGSVISLIGGVDSVYMVAYDIRIAATQSYLPDEKRARFNGAYQMLTSLGSLGGTLLAGSLAEVMPERAVVLLFSAVGLAAAWLFIFRRRREVAILYNREV